MKIQWYVQTLNKNPRERFLMIRKHHFKKYADAGKGMIQNKATVQCERNTLTKNAIDLDLKASKESSRKLIRIFSRCLILEGKRRLFNFLQVI